VNLCEMQNVCKDYQRAGQSVTALQDFSMALSPGKVTGLLGPNGAGKTTAIKILLSLTSADRGRLLWRGEYIRSSMYLKHIGALLEGRGALNERLTTWENANYFCSLRETKFDHSYYFNLLELLSISHSKVPVRLLSTGNKLKSALLLCLIHKPTLVLLDEPTIGLDLFGTEQLELLVRYLADRGDAVLLSSHDLAFVERTSDSIVCIRKGQKVFDGSKTSFLEFDYTYVLQITCSLALLPTRPELNWRSCDNGAVQLFLRDYASLCNTMATLMPILPDAVDLQIHRVTLEQKYRELVDSSEDPQ
jgi:ABC-type multidrug transport system ATPase subunit